jgi:hypothetical protein
VSSSFGLLMGRRNMILVAEHTHNEKLSEILVTASNALDQLHHGRTKRQELWHTCSQTMSVDNPNGDINQGIHSVPNEIYNTGTSDENGSANELL